MKINYSHRITARLVFNVGFEPREPGEYIVLDADYNVFAARWNGEYFVGDYKSIVGWCPLDRKAALSPFNEATLNLMTEIYGDFNTTRYG